MPRLEPPGPYIFESPLLELDAYRLLQIIHSSASMHRSLMHKKEKGDQGSEADRIASNVLFRHLQSEETEASRLIMTLAIIVRNGSDRIPIFAEEEITRSIQIAASEPLESEPPKNYPDVFPRQIYGWFKREGLEPEWLNMRNTCNKIIHASKVEWGRDEESEGQPLDGHLWLYGQRNLGKKDEHWVALIDVEDFCICASRLV